jgi:N4-gp56 family major capsid protein
MLTYNNPAGGVPSSIEGDGSAQMNIMVYQRKALIEAQKEMYFTSLADVTAMPKHYGKTIKAYHYIPLLDDRNVNDQGIDAAGVTIAATEWSVTFPSATLAIANASKAAAATAINDNVGSRLVATAGADGSAGTGLATLTLVGPLSVRYNTTTKKNAVVALNLGVSAEPAAGNLYGSSKDFGTIAGKLPTLTETGGRVNRVGFTRVLREGSIHKFGFFTEFTQESLDFDSDEELYSHISREMVTGAVQLSEAVLQKDLVAGAGVVVYAGAATSAATVTGEGATPSKVDYDDLARLSRILNDNRTPKNTKVISGSRMIDTKTINSGRVIFIGSELESIVKAMVDPFNNPAFVPAHQYGAGGTVLNGEIGSVDQFRFVVVPEMLHWAGAGAAEGSNPGYMATNGRYDVFPMLVVGEGSFTTIGFQTGGKMLKFVITTKMPGKETADRNDPYGETGFSSIKWYYGIMILRPERLALLKTIARI